MYAEQQEFISSLKTMTPENIIQYAYELVIREDILLSLEENDLDAKQCKALLREKKPLDKLFIAWEKHEGDHMNEIRDCIENKADELVKLARVRQTGTADRMAYYSQSAINRARKMDLLTYLQTYEPDELVKISGNTYTTKTHDSLKISNGMWMWWSRGIGGRSAVDYLMRVRDMTFIEAVSQIANDESALRKQYEKPKPRTERNLILPTKAENNDIAIEYLKQRGINEKVISYFIENDMLYQSVPMNNIVFVGYDENNIPKYAGMRGTEKYRYIGDAYGSDKTFPFRLVNKENTNIHIFEGAIDLLSYATLLYEQGSDFKSQNLVSLSGVYKPTKNMNNAQIPLALRTVLKDNLQLKTVYLHLDNDSVGRKAAEVISNLLKDKYTVKKHFVPVGKDVNDYLCYSKNLPYRTFEKEVACR